MAAVRGRKRTDDPTPNRARDIQRAFRARRAAHLESLEERIAELEEENNYFRALLHMPPSSRPILGKGPTGRGLAKSRSRITVDSFHSVNNVHSSPSPSDSPTTPTMECPIPLPATNQAEVYGQMVMNQESESERPTTNGNGPPQVHVNESFVFPHEKGVDPSACVDQFAYNNIPRSSSIDHGMVGLPGEFEAVSISSAMDPSSMEQSIYPDYSWAPSVAHPSMPIQAVDMQQQTNHRAFGYTQQTAQVSMAPRAVPAHMRPTHGHRRANTEPQSLGSLIAQGFNPGHRATSSEIMATGTPSPPPLPIRAPYQVHAYPQ